MQNDPTSIRPKAGMTFIHRDGKIRTITSVRHGRVHFRGADGSGKTLAILGAGPAPMQFFETHFEAWS